MPQKTWLMVLLENLNTQGVDNMFGLNETRYGTKDLIAWDVNGGVEDITLHNLLVEVGLLDEGHGYEELTVVWEYLDQEIHIQEIYDNDSGDVLWRQPSAWKDDDELSEEDQTIMNSLLMWGELESTIM